MDLDCAVELTAAAHVLVVFMWLTDFGRVAWGVAGLAAGAAVHAAYEHHRVNLRLLQWKARCRVKHWWAGLTAPPPPPKPPGPRRIPKPQLDNAAA